MPVSAGAVSSTTGVLHRLARVAYTLYVFKSTLLVFFSLSLPGLAEDTQLHGLRAALLATKHGPDAADRIRGASPQLTIAKHQLRDWVESRLKSLPFRGDEAEFARLLNADLRSAGLFCGDDAGGKVSCPGWTLLGVLNPINLRRTESYLVLQTGVGIECGFDESAYLYSWSDEGWRRVWQTEQNLYDLKMYQPQTIHKVLVSPYSRINNYVVLTLGSESWCLSNLHNVYYRVSRLGPDPSAKPLAEGEVWAHIDGDPPIQGSVTADDALIEATKVGGFEGAYEVIRHYRFDHDNVRRVDPFALCPRDFVYEWLTNQWTEVASWSESANRRTMVDWHEKLKDRTGELIYPTMHCPTTPDLWQVGVDFGKPPAIGAPPKAPNYFLVRWRPPYEFRMVEVSDHPWRQCTEKDRRADEARTLFAR
jgi:hypothetical protein